MEGPSGPLEYMACDIWHVCFPTPGRDLPYGSGLGLSRCLGPGECLHSFIHMACVTFEFTCLWVELI